MFRAGPTSTARQGEIFEGFDTRISSQIINKQSGLMAFRVAHSSVECVRTSGQYFKTKRLDCGFAPPQPRIFSAVGQECPTGDYFDYRQPQMMSYDLRVDHGRFFNILMTKYQFFH